MCCGVEPDARHQQQHLRQLPAGLWRDLVPLDQLYDLPELSAGMQSAPVEDRSNVFLRRTEIPGQGGGQYQAWLESLDGGQWNLKPTQRQRQQERLWPAPIIRD